MELDFDSDPEVCTPFYIGNIFSFKNLMLSFLLICVLAVR